MKQHWRFPTIILFLSLSIASNSTSLFAQNTSPLGRSLLMAGTDCLDDEEFPLAVDILSQAIAQAKVDNDPSAEADAHFYLAHANFWLANYQNANDHLYLLLNEFPTRLSQTDSMSILRMISQNHYYMGNYDIAHELALERLRSTEELKDSFNIAKSYQVLGEIECRQKDYDTALKHVQTSKQLFEKMGKTEELSYNLDLMGDIFHNTGRYKEALSYKIKSCQVIDTTGSLYNNAYCNHTIALTLNKMGRREEAISLYRLALASWVKARMPEETALTRACLGEAIAGTGQCAKGIALMKVALSEAEKLSMSPLRRDILEKLFQVNKQCGEIESAFFYLEKYILVNDSLNNQNTKVRIASLSNDYELDKKNAEFEVLKHKENIKAQFIVFLLAGIILLLCFGLISHCLLKKQRSYSLQLDTKSKQIAQQYEDIHRTNEKLKLANKELEQFAYLASHDLKTPLRTIGNYASLINRRYSAQLDENGITFLGFITEAAKHMNALLEDILSYTKVSKDEMEIVDVNLHERLLLALKLLHELIDSKKATIRYATLPIVKGNPTQLYQLLQNLLDNALKFIPDDRQPLIQVNFADEGEFYRIDIQDNGIGIEQNKQEEVFTIFKRLHTREEYKGTGIGLAICKKIVEAHGGRIWITSDGKNGTTFHFTLKK